MKHRTIPILFACCLFIFSFAGVAAAEAPAPPSDLPSLVESLGELREAIRELRSEVGQLRQAVTTLHRATLQPTPVPTPPAATVEVSLGAAPRLGEATATVGIVEFTDYQCPFCKRFHDQTFSKLKAQYIDTGKIQYVVRDFPLAFHGQATSAAVAAHCAQAQGEYWTMHHELFTNQRRLGPALYEELATAQGLNSQQFAACLTDPARAQSVDADLAYGKTVGVRGTPHFFIGRIADGTLIGARRLSGAQPFETFSRALTPLLERQQ